jgi:hypothetical protein
MMKRYTLKPLNGMGAALEFAWDPESGDVRGPDGDYVRAVAAEGVHNGAAMGYPYPTTYPITDPLRRPGEMAVLLGNLWLLPEELAAAYPVPPTDNGFPPARE